MKKIIAVLLTVLLVLSVSMLFVSADENESIDVHVTIVDENSDFALAYKTVTVTDIDDDKVLTINDALYAAHEQFYDGGAAAGYATETTKWGLSLMKLWGVANGGSYGYLVNNSFAWSMTDPVQADDYIVAFIYTDTEDFSDVYTYFDKQYIEGTDSSVVLDLTLMKTGYDKDGKPYTEPIPDAEITIDGQTYDIRTDEQGKVYCGFGTSEPEGFEKIVSATVDGMRIVPPICIAKATGMEEATPDQPIGTEMPTVVADVDEGDDTPSATEPATNDESTKDSSTNDSATKDSSPSAPGPGETPKTSDVTNLILWIVIAAVCFAGVVGAIVFYKKRYGKK